MAPNAQVVQSVLQRYAFELKGSVAPDFAVSPAWIAELNRRLAASGVIIGPLYEPAATRILSRELEHRIARLAFGDAAAKARELTTDRQLSAAVDLLRKSTTQRELFAVAHASPGAQ
jgi:hypothetical protein